MNKIAMQVLVYEADGEGHNNFLINYNFESYEKYFKEIENNDLKNEKKYLAIDKYSYCLYGKVINESLLIYKAFRGEKTNKNRHNEYDCLKLVLPKNTSIQELLDNELINDFLLKENFQEIFDSKYKNNFENELANISLNYIQNKTERKNHRKNIFTTEKSFEMKKRFIQDLMTLSSYDSSFFMYIGDLNKTDFIEKAFEITGIRIITEEDFFSKTELFHYFENNKKVYQGNSRKKDKVAKTSSKNEKQFSPNLNNEALKLYSERTDIKELLNNAENEALTLKKEIEGKKIKLDKANLTINQLIKNFQDINNEIDKLENNKSLKQRLQNLINREEDLIPLIGIPLIGVLIIGTIYYVLKNFTE